MTASTSSRSRTASSPTTAFATPYFSATACVGLGLGAADDGHLGIGDVRQPVEMLHTEGARGADDGDADLLTAHAWTSSNGWLASAESTTRWATGLFSTRWPTAVFDAGTW